MPVFSKNSLNFLGKSPFPIGSATTPRTRANSANSGLIETGLFIIGLSLALITQKTSSAICIGFFVARLPVIRFSFKNLCKKSASDSAAAADVDLSSSVFFSAFKHNLPSEISKNSCQFPAVKPGSPKDLRTATYSSFSLVSNRTLLANSSKTRNFLGTIPSLRASASLKLFSAAAICAWSGAVVVLSAVMVAKSNATVSPASNLSNASKTIAAYCSLLSVGLAGGGWATEELSSGAILVLRLDAPDTTIDLAACALATLPVSSCTAFSIAE